MKYIKILLGILMICPSVSNAQTDPRLLSPDGKVCFQFSLHSAGGPVYQVMATKESNASLIDHKEAFPVWQFSEDTRGVISIKNRAYITCNP